MKALSRLCVQFLTFFIILSMQLDAAKVPAFGWANKLWGGDDDGGFGFAVDPDGNSYIATAFFATDTLNGIRMTNAGLYIAKHGQEGNLLWARQVAHSNVYCSSLALDGAGNIFCAGVFFRSGGFGSTNLNNPSSFASDAYVAKFSTAGELHWVRQITGGFYEDANGVALDTNGNIFLTGAFTQTAFFSNTNLGSRGEDDIFLAKYDANGNLLWVRQAGGTFGDVGYSVAVSPTGEAWVGGSFTGTAHFDVFTPTSAGQSSGFVAKYDVDGHVAWVRPLGGDGFWNATKAVALDRNNEGVVGGYYSGSNALNGVSSPQGYHDALVAKYTSAGNLVWIQTGGGPGSDIAEDVALDRSGNVYFTGSFIQSFSMGEVNLTTTNEAEEVFVAKLDHTGRVAFLESVSGTGDDYGYGIGVDARANCYVTGFFQNDILFDDLALTSSHANPSHTFLARMETQTPSLTVGRANGKVQLSWPLWAADFALEWTQTLTTPSWDTFPVAPTNDGQQWTAKASVNLESAFFRLRQR